MIMTWEAKYLPSERGRMKFTGEVKNTFNASRPIWGGRFFYTPALFPHKPVNWSRAYSFFSLAEMPAQFKKCASGDGDIQIVPVGV